MAVAASSDTALKLSRDGQIIWNHATVGKLEPGGSLLKPRATVLAGDQPSGSERELVQARLQKFVDRHIASALEPLVKLEEAEGLDGIARGIAFRLAETLGVLPRNEVTEEVKGLSQEDRSKLRTLGARFGAFNLYVPALLKPAATELRLLLWALQLQKEGKLDPANLPQPPGQGLTSAVFDRTTPKGFYGVCGYRICGSRVVRIDMLERLVDMIRDRVFWRPRFPEEPRPAGSVEGGGFMVVADMMSLVGCSGEDFLGIIKSLDFRLQKKTVKRPLAAPAGITAETGSVETAPVETELAQATSVEAIAAPASSEVTIASEVEAEPPAESEPSPAATSLDAPPADDSAGPAETAAEPAAQPAAVADVPMEEIEIEVWWPKDTGPFRPRPERSRELSRRGPPQRAASGEAKPSAAGETKPEAQPRHFRPRRNKVPAEQNRPPADEHQPTAERHATGEHQPTAEHQPRGERQPRVDRQPRDDRQPRGEHQPRGERQAKGERPPSGEFKPRRDSGKDRFDKPISEERKPRVEKPLDPLSPFAVLAALKEKLAGK